MASTYANSSGLESAITRLRDLITDDTIGKFRALGDFGLNAGPPEIDAAQWLEGIITDRKHGIMEHVIYLQKVFGSLADLLENVGLALTDTDSYGASTLNKGGADAAINEWITFVNGLDLPPAVPDDHLLSGKDDYGTGDTGGSKAEFTFDYDSTYDPNYGANGVTINIPTREGLPNQELFGIFDEVAGAVDTELIVSGTKEKYNVGTIIFNNGTEIITENAPEN
jgi:hypothetical protein